jgi:hypothetical protein
MSSDEQDSSGKPPQSSDVALIHGVTPEGDLRILRKRNDRIELGGVRPLREGVPITGEVVRLTPRKECPLLCDVSTELAAPRPPADVAEARSTDTRKGPAQVATDRYRDNWDQIFTRRPGSDLAN